MVSERLGEAADQLPENVDATLGPVATGLGEIFLYTVAADADARQSDGRPYDSMALRSLQDWVIKPQLRQVRGVAEINSIGGYAHQIHVTPDPLRMLGFGVTFEDIVEALEHDNGNVGAGFIERNGEELLVRATGQAASAADLASVVIADRGGRPVRVARCRGRRHRQGASHRRGDARWRGNRARHRTHAAGREQPRGEPARRGEARRDPGHAAEGRAH